MCQLHCGGIWFLQNQALRQTVMPACYRETTDPHTSHLELSRVRSPCCVEREGGESPHFEKVSWDLFTEGYCESSLPTLQLVFCFPPVASFPSFSLLLPTSSHPSFYHQSQFSCITRGGRQIGRKTDVLHFLMLSYFLTYKVTMSTLHWLS